MIPSCRSFRPRLGSRRGSTRTGVRVLWTMKILDPSFSMEGFECELCEYIVPEVVNTYLSADNEALKSWYSEAVRLVSLLRYLSN